jgi:hypothetical protein
LAAGRAVVFPSQCFAAQSQRIAQSAAPPVAAGFIWASCRCFALAFSRLAFRCHPDRAPSATRDLLYRVFLESISISTSTNIQQIPIVLA